MKIKRFAAVAVLSTSLAVSVLTGCGNKDESLNEGAAYSEGYMEKRNEEGHTLARILNGNTDSYKITYNEKEGNIHLMPVGESAALIKELINYRDVASWAEINRALASLSEDVAEASEYNFGLSLLNPYKDTEYVIVNAFDGHILYFWMD